MNYDEERLKKEFRSMMISMEKREKEYVADSIQKEICDLECQNREEKFEITISEYSPSPYTCAIPLDDIKFFLINDEGLQQILKDKKIFDQYEWQICWTTGDKGDLWRVTPVKR